MADNHDIWPVLGHSKRDKGVFRQNETLRVAGGKEDLEVFQFVSVKINGFLSS